MAEQTIPTKFKLRHDIASNWTTKNPVLLEGEVGFETDTLNFKVGNGTSAWNDLAYYIPTKYMTTNTEQTILATKTFNNIKMVANTYLTTESGSNLIGHKSSLDLLVGNTAYYLKLYSVNRPKVFEGSTTNSQELAYLSDVPTIYPFITKYQTQYIDGSVKTQTLQLSDYITDYVQGAVYEVQFCLYGYCNTTSNDRLYSDLVNLDTTYFLQFSANSQYNGCLGTIYASKTITYERSVTSGNLSCKLLGYRRIY